jgi:chaperonin GroES
MEIDISTIKPMPGLLLGKLIKEEAMSPGGIAVPEGARKTKHEIEVVTLGHPKEDEAWPKGLKVGDEVIIASYGGLEVEFNKENYVFLKSADLVAVKE